MKSVDLNCDLGEGCVNEAELMSLVTSANVACGGHVGDDASMRAAVRSALRHHVALGAHPSYVDRRHFGRLEQSVTAAEALALVLTQTRSLQAIAQQEGTLLRHVKLHGAFYNQAARDAILAEAVVDAIVELRAGLILFAPAGSVLYAVALRKGVPAASEVFADRTYQADGSLTPRSSPQAFISDERAAVAQVLEVIQHGAIRSVDKTELPMRADTICVHGDGPQALALLRAVRSAVTAAGVSVNAVHGMNL